MICQVPGCITHYGCRLRNKGIQLSPRATPTATQNWKPTPSVPHAPNAEIMYDERPGGTKIPFLHPDGSVVRRCDLQADKTIAEKIRNARTVVPTP